MEPSAVHRKASECLYIVRWASTPTPKFDLIG